MLECVQSYNGIALNVSASEFSKCLSIKKHFCSRSQQLMSVYNDHNMPKRNNIFIDAANMFFGMFLCAYSFVI